MKVAIVLDSWKLPTFERILTTAGYQYTTGPGPFDKINTTLLMVETDSIAKLQPIAQLAAREAARIKLN